MSFHFDNAHKNWTHAFTHIQRVIKMIKQTKAAARNPKIPNWMKKKLFGSDHEWTLNLKNFQTPFGKLHQWTILE